MVYSTRLVWLEDHSPAVKADAAGSAHERRQSLGCVTTVWISSNLLTRSCRARVATTTILLASVSEGATHCEVQAYGRCLFPSLLLAFLLVLADDLVEVELLMGNKDGMLSFV